MSICSICVKNSNLNCPCGIVYCSKDCQKKDFEKHKRICNIYIEKIMKKIENNFDLIKKHPSIFLDSGRLKKISVELDENDFKDKWNSNILINDNNNNHQQINKSTLKKDVLIKSAEIILNCFLQYEETELFILETFCGNCIASKTIFDLISDKFLTLTIKPTDVINFIRTDLPNYYLSFDQLNALESVKNYYNTSNVLLMISPPPGSDYCDYFSLKFFIEKSNSKYIIFIGELGSSDGSQGLYDFLINNNNLILLVREILDSYIKIHIFRDLCEKELFIFKII